ncbi:hypothetical protein C8E03_102226 [Lachnotalea glycerini]|uniref:PHP domain-containing protein n=1 Tax=Lachnotalea glycerini TaxID=1763509 RepID=A0A255IUI0_9FIRM|nr:PHP domain-containing protein [Lachnotalea glycerini]PXV93458.1 hypothetical protein C8E03_102226 [Lachnotalea glycerini]RDY31813.1 PHP domain-containing protein [Lachnotalea glycerini]
MKIDFHTHGKLTKKIPFSSQYTDWLFEEATKSGLDAICLTEHFNTCGFAEIYEYIRQVYEKDGDYFIAPTGLHIFPGAEVDIAEGGHTLVIGDIDTILEINQRLEPYKEKGLYLSFEMWARMVKEYSVLFGGAHPFREGGHIPELLQEQQEAFDFLDLNGKDMAQGAEKNRAMIDELSKKIQRPIVAGSDTHQSFQYGCIYNDFQNNCSTIGELRREMDAGCYEIAMSDYLSFQVRAAGCMKRSLKTIYAMGGDYVSIMLDE